LSRNLVLHPQPQAYDKAFEDLRNREIQQQIRELTGRVDGVEQDTVAVYVAAIGDDNNSGLSAFGAKRTIAAGISAASSLISGGQAGVRIDVLDGATYTENFTVSAGMHLTALSATIVGQITLTSDASVNVNYHYAASNSQVMLEKSGGTGHGFYTANKSDGRGTGGLLTGVQNFNNSTNGSVLVIRTGICYVSADGVGIGNRAGGFGHIHFNLADLYLAGNNAIGIQATYNNSDIIGYVDHILEINSPTGTTGILVSHASAIVKLTATEIKATLGAAYNISAGTLHLVCSRMLGTRTGTPVFEVSDQSIGSAAYQPASRLNPSGGTTGQVLKKNSNTNYDYSWAADDTGAGSPAWGAITGTLSAQTDLNSALGAKANSDGTNFVIENRTSDPGSPATGQIWLRTDL
jgi:hypothetical protein